VIREIARQAPLRVRPGETSTRTRLSVSGRALAGAAAAAAYCRVPVDAAIASAVQLATVEPDASEEDVRRLTVGLRPSRSVLTAAENDWIRQLRHGCSWYQHKLPVVWLPAAVLQAASPEQVLAGVSWASEPQRLRALLDLECAAIRGGVAPAEAFALLKRRGPTARASG